MAERQRLQDSANSSNQYVYSLSKINSENDKSGEASLRYAELPKHDQADSIYARIMKKTGYRSEMSKKSSNTSHDDDNKLYENIIPIKLNAETIYAQVETGKITINKTSSKPSNKYLSESNEIHSNLVDRNESTLKQNREEQTIYAEINLSRV